MATAQKKRQLARYVTDDFSPFLHTHSVPIVVVFRDSSQDLSQEWSPYRLVDVVPAHNAAKQNISSTWLAIASSDRSAAARVCSDYAHYSGTLPVYT